MQHADPAVVRRALLRSWRLPEPVVVETLDGRGVTADVFEVTDGVGARYVAKLIYDTQPVAEAGLAVAEIVRDRTGIDTAAPIRTTTGAVTVMVPSVADLTHPLTLLPFVSGPRLTPDERPAETGRLLAGLHRAMADLGPIAPDGVIGYLLGDSVDPGSGQIASAVRATVTDVTARSDLTWGACYGDGPELVDTGAGLALIDWGAVARAPLLWDVSCWSSACREPAVFLDAYVGAGGLSPRELTLLPLMERLRAAQQLKFRNYRVTHADLYDETVVADRAALQDAVRAFGIELTESTVA